MYTTTTITSVTSNNNNNIIGNRQRYRKYSKIYRSYYRNIAHVELTNKSGTTDNKGNWNCLKIIQKVPEQHTVKALIEGTTVNNHIGHCTHTSRSTIAELQNICHGK